LRDRLLRSLPGWKRSAGPAVACSEDGTAQMLVGFYRTGGLKQAVQELASRGRLIDGSMRSLLASLDLQLVTVPAGTTADVDTWDDAAALGVDAGKPDVRQDRRGSS
jgi:CTP:molybdopterin cytidylyltransferase MocA